MSLNIHLRDPGTKKYAKVTARGQVITGPIATSKFYNAVADTDNVSVQLVEPKSDQAFIITAIVLYANKGVGANDATVELFHCSASDVNSGVNIIKQEMLKQTTLPLLPLEIEISAGRWIKVVTDDNSIFCNLAGYYVDA